MGISFEDIVAARARIEGGVLLAPCPFSLRLSEAAGARIFCKLEYLQRTGSFKERGARNALLLLDERSRRNGAIAASAGNHALGLAYHGQALGIPITVVMPESAPQTKITNCRKMGARVILAGQNIEEAGAKARELMQQEPLTYINGYDDPAVIAGQGTMGLEMIEQVPEADAILVPVGGAGLIAGIALAAKSLKPAIRVIAICAENAPSFARSCRNGKPSHVAPVPTLADGLAVPKVGTNGFEIASRLVDQTVLVNEAAIALAILRLMEWEKSVVEGAGATPLAVLLSGLLPDLAGKVVILPLTGGNIDTHILGHIIERGLAADGRLWRFSAVISDKPGGLAALTAILAEEKASIREIHHDRATSEDLNHVRVHCLVETRDHAHIAGLAERLRREHWLV